MRIFNLTSSGVLAQYFGIHMAVLKDACYEVGELVIGWFHVISYWLNDTKWNGCWVAARCQELCYFGDLSFFDLCCSCSSISYQLSERKQLSAIMKDGRMKVVIDVLEIIHLYPLKSGDHCFHRFLAWEDLCTSTVSKSLPCTPGAGSRSANNSNVVTAWMATGRIYCSLPWLGGD